MGGLWKRYAVWIVDLYKVRIIEFVGIVYGEIYEDLRFIEMLGDQGD